MNHVQFNLNAAMKKGTQRHEVLSQHLSRLQGSWDHTIPHTPSENQAVFRTGTKISGFPPTKRHDLLNHLNALSPIGAASRYLWKIKTTAYFDPATREVAKSCRILCCCEGSTPKNKKPEGDQPVKRRQTSSKQVNCPAFIHVVWLDRDSDVCVVVNMNLKHNSV